MKTIALDTALKTLDGKIIPLSNEDQRPFAIKDVLINILANVQQGPGADKLKAYHLARRMQETEEMLEVDESDFKFVVRMVTQSPIYNALVIGQTLDYLNNLGVEQK